jgi:hypothetical protein
MRRLLLPALTCCLLVSSALAATLSGVAMPDTYDVDGKTLVLNGIGLRTFTIFHIRGYVAALYLPEPSRDARQILDASGPKVIRLKFIRGGSKAEVEQEYRKGEAINCGHGECAPSDQSDFERLVAAAPAVSPGDTSTYVFTDGRVRVYANDRLIGDFANPDLARRLLSGFIGDHPPTQALRSQLLGLPTG